MISTDCPPVVDDEEDEYDTVPAKPLELEEMILRMMENPEDEEY